MKHNINGIRKKLLSIVLAAMMCLTGIGTFAADLTVERWNATTTTFTATLSGEANDVAVTVGGKAATVEKANAGGKTSITAALADKLALDAFYPVKITADGQTVYNKEVKLQKLWEDNFDYADNNAIGAVYKAINGWSGVTVEDGKMKLANGANEGTIYHTALDGEQATWQDYTLDVDYIPSTDEAKKATKGAFIYMEAHPAAVDEGNMKYGNLYKMSTASATIRENDVQTSCANNGATTEGFNYKNLTDVTNGISTEQNIQISTKDGHAMILADKKGGGKVVQDFEIPAGAPRGGGFAFSVRNVQVYYLDNLKVYKAVEKETPVDPPVGPGGVYDISYWNATTSAAYVTLDGEASGIISVKNPANGEYLKVDKKINGGKTELTIQADKPFEMGEEYSLQIFENSTESAVLRFKLVHMFEDNFDSYQENAEIRKVYSSLNGWSAAYVEDRKLKMVTSPGSSTYETTVYHNEFETAQKEWQDYTLDVDYVPGDAATRADNAHIYMEAHPSAVNESNMKYANLLKMSTASVTITKNGVSANYSNNGADGSGYNTNELVGVTGGTSKKQNIQISTRDGHAMVLADKEGGGKVVQDFEIPAGAPRGGGFAFVTRAGKTYCLDNLRIYKAVTPPESRDTMTLESEAITAKKADFTFSEEVSRFQGSRITLNKYQDGDIKPVPVSVEADGKTLSVVPNEALAGGTYCLKLAKSITSVDDSKGTEDDIVRFFQVSGGNISPIANWTSDPAYGETKMFDDTITLTFEQSVNVSTISADSVKVYKDGTEISGATASAADKTVTVNLNEAAEFDTKYQVRFTGAAKFTENYGFPELTFFTPNGLALTDFNVKLRDIVIHPTISIGGETISMGATIKSNEKARSRSVMVTFCVFDTNGKMCRIGGERITVAAGQTEEAVANMQIPDGNGYSIKCFVWDSFENLIGIHEEIWR